MFYTLTLRMILCGDEIMKLSFTVQKECDGTCIVLTHAYYTHGYPQKPPLIYMSYHYIHQIARVYGLTFSRACFCRLCYLMSSSFCVLPQYMCVLLHMVLDTRDSYSCQSQFYFSCFLSRRSLHFLQFQFQIIKNDRLFFSTFYLFLFFRFFNLSKIFNFFKFQS